MSIIRNYPDSDKWSLLHGNETQYFKSLDEALDKHQEIVKDNEAKKSLGK